MNQNKSFLTALVLGIIIGASAMWVATAHRQVVIKEGVLDLAMQHVPSFDGGSRLSSIDPVGDHHAQLTRDYLHIDYGDGDVDMYPIGSISKLEWSK